MAIEKNCEIVFVMYNNLDFSVAGWVIGMFESGEVLKLSSMHVLNELIYRSILQNCIWSPVIVEYIVVMYSFDDNMKQIPIDNKKSLFFRSLRTDYGEIGEIEVRFRTDQKLNRT